MSRSSAAWLVLAATLWGTTGTAQVLGGAGSSPWSVGAVRVLVGALGLAAVGGHRLSRPPWGWLGVGGLAIAGYQVSFFSAVDRAGVTLATVVAIGSGPLLAGLLGRIFRAEPLTRRWSAATVTGVAGVIIIAGRPDQVDPKGVALAVAAGLAYALATVASKHLVEVVGATAAMTWMFGAAALLLAPLIPAADLAWLGRPAGLMAGLWLGLGATTAAYLAFARGLRGARVGDAASVGLVEPATATLLGVLLLGERPAGPAWAGMLLVGLALVLLVRGERLTAGRATTPRHTVPRRGWDRRGRGPSGSRARRHR